MADIAAFPTTIGPSLTVKGKIGRYVAGADVKANQVLCYAATGVDETLIPAVAGAGTQPVGVAIFAAKSGEPIAVAEEGCEIDVVNADDTTGIDAGDYLAANDNAVGGTVSAVDLTPAGATATAVYVIGRAKQDIGGGAYGKCVVHCEQIIIPNAS